MTRGYLLDTNVVSETRKRQPNPQVLTFVNGLHSSSIFASVLTLAELRKGVTLKRRSDEATADALLMWTEQWEQAMGSQLLPIDASVARAWGNFHQRRTLAVVDSLLAATALAHGLTLVTRNTADIADLGVDLLNPWLA